MNQKTEKNILCPNCDHKASLIKNEVIKDYRKEKFNVFEFYYLCNNCGFEFTTSAIDEVTVNQVYNAYREQNGIPFPEELIQLRKKYNLSQREMSKLLSFGQNIWANYESGEVPSKANAEYITLLFNDQAFRDLFDRKKNLLNKISIKNLASALTVVDTELKSWIHPDWLEVPTKFNGYKIPSFIKFSELINYIVSKGNGNEFRTKLNKIVKYCDFTFFKRFGKSITGCKYAVLPYGVCPSNHDSYYSIMIEHGLIENNWLDVNGADIPKLISKSHKLDDQIFNEQEIAVIEEIVSALTSMTRNEVIELDHTENEWCKTKIGSLVDYRSTFNLKAF